MGKRSTAFFISVTCVVIQSVFQPLAYGQSSCPGLDAKLCPSATADQNNLIATLSYFDRGMIRPVLREMQIFSPRALQPTEQERYVSLLTARIAGPTHAEVIARFETLKLKILTQLERGAGFEIADPKGLKERVSALKLRSPSELLQSRRSIFDQACGPFAHVPNAIWVKPEPGKPDEFIAYCPALLFAALALEPIPSRALDTLEPALLHALGRAFSTWVDASPSAQKCASKALGSRIEWSPAWSAEILTRSASSPRLVCALQENQELPSGIERVRAVWGGSGSLRAALGCAVLPDCTY